MQRIEFRAMNCQMLAMVDSDLASVQATLAHVPAWFEGWEQCFSRFRPNSELSRLNQHDGQWVALSQDLFDVMVVAVWAAAWSDGLVLPTLLSLMEDIGYGQTFEQIRHAQTSAPLSAHPLCGLGWRDIELDAHRRIRMPRGMRVDLGGLVKGWAAQQAAQRLSACGPALVDAGGDISITSACTAGELWPIGVADPLHPNELLTVLQMGAGSVATSGRDYRRWRQDGKWQHHILDPRTSAPANTDVLSATVVAETMLEAEVASKVALILGSQEGLLWLQHHALAGLLVLQDGQVLRNAHTKKHDEPYTM